MPYILPQYIKPKRPNYLVFKNFLSEKECSDVIFLKEKVQPEDSRVGEAISDNSFRSSTIRWIQPSIDTIWIYEKLSPQLVRANEKEWGFHLAGFVEPLQLTHYESSKGGHYNWHQDYAPHDLLQNRKFSGTILLNDEFESGELEFYGIPEQPKMEKGDLILFPAYTLHQVKTVTEGERWSLVFWISGPPYV